MRLIDADKLKAHYSWWPENERTVLDQIVDAQPTVDAVPVVRCRECKYFLPEWPDDASSVYQCHKGLGWPEPDGYCYKGERKDGAE